ncbi:Transcriptional regulator, MerR family [hydrothermal vent metagenome]|uniref:Mercuric resistance operon regulatory protein n=1 Tax=hydrothermal vent metagenome TaxID=652676 RepID=A0A3B1BCJ7_9ZZZZ
MNYKTVKKVEPLTIGQVAKLSDVGVETVRFYERRGLIDEPPRKDSGYRQYPEGAVKRINFIKKAKELGFTLKEISELLNLRLHSGGGCADVRAKALEKISDVKGKIGELNKIQKALTKLAASCKGDGPVSDCPILEALDDKEE